MCVQIRNADAVGTFEPQSEASTRSSTFGNEVPAT
jgi:hypothetical protein